MTTPNIDARKEVRTENAPSVPQPHEPSQSSKRITVSRSIVIGLLILVLIGLVLLNVPVGIFAIGGLAGWGVATGKRQWVLIGQWAALVSLIIGAVYLVVGSTLWLYFVLGYVVVGAVVYTLKNPPKKPVINLLDESGRLIGQWPTAIIEAIGRGGGGRYTLTEQEERERAATVAKIIEYSKKKGVELTVAIELEGLKKSTYYDWKRYYYKKYPPD